MSMPVPARALITLPIALTTSTICSNQPTKSCRFFMPAGHGMRFNGTAWQQRPASDWTAAVSDTWPIQPPAPSGLTASGSKRKVTLAWTAATGAETYRVKRATISGGSYTVIASAVTGTNYLDSGVTPGVTYYYVVSAVNTAGESPNSNQAGARPK